MLAALKFVVGAVAKKDFVPALQHFSIQNGIIKGYNGMLSLCSPIPIEALNVRPKALPLVKAIQACKETVAIHMTAGRRLSIKSGSFKALIECFDDEFPSVEPEGELVHLKGELLSVLKLLLPFVGEDASRPWAMGILLSGQSAFATNNVCLVEYWLGYDFPIALNIPKAAIIELLRIGIEPQAIQWAENNVTFHFPEGRWLRTQTYLTNWPQLDRILNGGQLETHGIALSPDFWEALETLAPFADEYGRVFFTNGSASTASDSTAATATFDLPELTAVEACFNLKKFLTLKPIIERIDLSEPSGPCRFIGDRLRGAIVGMRP